jgi:ABC-type multidrug transport system fused ATPase/permease subunit
MIRSGITRRRTIGTMMAVHWRVLLAGIALVILARISGLVLPASTKLLIDDVIVKHNRTLLLPLTAAVLGAGIVQAGASFLVTRLLTRAGHRLVTELRLKLQAHIGRLPLSYFDRRRTGELSTHIMIDVEGVRHLLGNGVIEFIGGLVSAAIGTAVLLSISPALTVLALLCLLTFAFITRHELRKFGPLIRERQRINSEVAGRLGESLSGIRVVKAYAAESQESRVFADGCRRLLDVLLRTCSRQALMSFSAALTTGFVGAAVMFAGANLVIDGALTLGDLLTFTVFLAFVVSPAMQLVNVGGQLTEAIASLERCHEVFRQVPEQADSQRAHMPDSWGGRIEFRDVWFSYGGGTSVLRGINFEAEPGTLTALVGPSGAGKSSVVSLIAAFYTASRGYVLADGIDLSTMRLDAWRSQLGVVLQDTFLFGGTIRDNITFACPDASEADFLRACRIAHVDEFANRFSNGYDTVVGERGVKLSGGQKQRVSIARAILANPRDSESESMIQEGLQYLIQGRTTFVIAHRLSTIRAADQILVLEDGQIVERGRHDSLYERGGRYFELCARQYLTEMEQPV